MSAANEILIGAYFLSKIEKLLKNNFGFYLIMTSSGNIKGTSNKTVAKVQGL